MNLPKKAWGAEFTLAIGCPLNCHYCPQEKLIKKYISEYGKDKLQMSFEDFKTCLSKIIPGSGITFSGMCEPFINNDCAKMIRYAYESGFQIDLYTTLVGMREEDFEMIKDVKFNLLRLHIPDKENNAKFIITDEYLSMFKKFNSHFDMIDYSCHGTIHPAVKDSICENDMVFDLDYMLNRAGNLEYEELSTYQHKGNIVCAGSGGAGWSIEILPNGTVTLCCMDYGMDHILGNLVEQEWEEIVTGEEFLKIEKGMFDEGISTLCRQCPLAKVRECGETLNLFSPNAIRINRILQKFISGELQISNVAENLDKKSIDIIEKLTSGKTICIFGIGKLFDDNYFNSCWSDILNARFISDNNYNSYMDKYNIEFIEPDKLINIKDLLVVIYVKNSSEIEKQLTNMGITNYIAIDDIYNLFYNIDL